MVRPDWPAGDGRGVSLILGGWNVGERRRSAQVIFCVLIATMASATGAQSGDPRTAQAAAVFESHCARCHQVGRLENPPAKGGLGNLLDFERLIERDDLIVPSNPDASRLYQIMLTRHRPQSVFFGPVPGPTPAEIGVVRDWLSSLPPRTEVCADRSPVAIADLERDIAAWRKTFETDVSKPLRFVSLSNLHNLCRSYSTLAAYRNAIETLMSRLTLRPITTMDTVGDASVLLAFRPSELGLTAEAWDLRAGKGDDSLGVVAAEALAARALAAASPTQASTGPAVSPISSAIAAPVPLLIDGLDPVEALAGEYTRTVSLKRAAVELRRDQSDLKKHAIELKGEEQILALRLIETGLPRAEWEQLKSHLMDRSWPSNRVRPASQFLALSLWTDALTYKTGDLLTVLARPTGDCNLTVIAVEADGLATVLYPNDSSTDNRVVGGTLVRIPADGAPFQFRLDKPGRHSVVAVCNATAKRPQGIGHDFERQRFTVLGDWRTFLLQTAEREAQYQKTQDDLRKFRTGAGGAEMLDEQLPQGTEDEVRAGLSVEVE